MTLKKNYLTAEEIAFITENMINTTDEYQRQIIRYGLVAQLTVDGLDITDGMTNNDIYNVLIENAIDLDKSITNIDIVDKIVDRELGVARTVEKILNGVIAQIDESMKAIDPKTLMVELDKLKDSEAFKMLAKA